jgi:hypothetical protein
MHGRPAEQNKARQQSRAPRQMQYRRFTLASADEQALMNVTQETLSKN